MNEMDKIEVTIHPEYQEEILRLRDVKHAIDLEIDKIYSHQGTGDSIWERYGGADEHTASVLYTLVEKKLLFLRNFKENPYFGRIDIENIENEKNIYLIGYRFFETNNHSIIDWRAPVSRLFYRNPTGTQVFKSIVTPQGYRYEKLLLKRHFRIASGELKTISDEFDIRNKASVMPNISPLDEIIKNEIYSRGEPRLQDIVKTILEHQDDLIRSPSDCTMIVNGVAGSGKTSIAYHRVAYLLFPGTKDSFHPNNVIVFGPNRLFMSYVRELLPTLGIHNVNQTSFDDWALMRLNFLIPDNNLKNSSRSGKPQTKRYLRKYKIQESALRAFLDPETTRNIRIAHWRRSRLKGSEKFILLMESYAKRRCESLSLTKKELKIFIKTPIEIEFCLSINEIKHIFMQIDFLNLPYEKIREQIFFKIRKLLVDESRIKQMLIGKRRNHLKVINNKLDQKTGKSKDENKNQYSLLDDHSIFSQASLRKISDQVEKQLKYTLEEFFPIFDPRNDYYKFISDRNLLLDLGSGNWTLDEVNLLSSMIPDQGTIDIEDIPPMLYLNLLMKGAPNFSYDHILIDEAQDFSPLQFKIVNMFSKSGSMTIVGDVSQGIFAHCGISSWNEVLNILSNRKPIYKEITTSYRSTQEITKFTNEVLIEVRKEKPVLLAKPFDRSGELPIITESSTKSEIYFRIARDLERIVQSGSKSIGIITKSKVECDEAFEQLKKFEKLLITKIDNRDLDYEYDGGVVILPVELSKGIEFQAVIIVNASEKNFDISVEYDGRLLYVALTRALHILHIYSVGPVTQYFNSAMRFAKVIKRI